MHVSVNLRAFTVLFLFSLLVPGGTNESKLTSSLNCRSVIDPFAQKPPHRKSQAISTTTPGCNSTVLMI